METFAAGEILVQWTDDQRSLDLVWERRATLKERDLVLLTCPPLTSRNSRWLPCGYRVPGWWSGPERFEVSRQPCGVSVRDSGSMAEGCVCSKLVSLCDQRSRVRKGRAAAPSQSQAHGHGDSSGGESSVSRNPTWAFWEDRPGALSIVLPGTVLLVPCPL